MAVDNPKSTSSSRSIEARFQTSIPTTYLTLPSQWLTNYSSFVRANAAQVSQLESALRTLTYLIPGRFHDTPLTSESLHTFLSLLTAYHNHLLPSNSPPPPGARYQRFCKRTSSVYARCAALLRTIQYTQLLCEMCAKRAGEKVRWRVVVVLEAVKATLRLLMGYGSGKRALIGTEVGPERYERSAVDEPDLEDGEEGLETGEWKMPRTGMRLPQLPSMSRMRGESVVDFLGKRVLTADEIKSANRLVRRMTTLQGQIAEVMWVLRPLLYTLLLQKCQSNKKDWRPWALGLTLEVASRQLAKKDVTENVIGGTRGLSGVEREEIARRAWGMAWWGLRGAFYRTFTQGYVQGLAGKLKGRSLLDMVGVVVEDYDYLWDEYYFSTATM